MRKIILSILSASIVMTLLTACNSDVVWFERKDNGELKPYSDNQLKTDVFYIKQGTKFYETYDVSEGTARSVSHVVRSDRLIPVVDTNHIPDHYINELVAYTSNKKMIESVTLERFRDCGYTIGVYGATIDDDGMFYANANNEICKESDFYSIIKQDSAKDFRIVSIDGRPLEKSDIDYSAGIIKGLEQGQTYHISYYSGTYYKEADVVADTLVLQSYEMFFYDKTFISYTTNGYICFNTPDDLRSGYYYINGDGLFRYFDHNKGDQNDVDMNISYYDSEQARIEAYSRQYSIDINTKVKDAAICVKYYPVTYSEEITEEDIAGYVYAPDGTQYSMTRNEDDNELVLNLTEAAIGEWKVNITPKTLEIQDVSFDSTKLEEQATLIEKVFEYDEDLTNMIFTADTKGPDEVFGYVVADDGRTHDMEYDYDDKTQVGRIYYELAYVPKGRYTVRIYYHPTTTEIGEIEDKSNISTETDIIYVGD